MRLTQRAWVQSGYKADFGATVEYLVENQLVKRFVPGKMRTEQMIDRVGLCFGADC